MLIEIKHKLTGAVLFSVEARSLKLAVETAVNKRAYLAGANLVGAGLARADLARADLAGANLAGANLARADLAGANLAGADLAGANLAGADLAGADLARADLAGADLAGANLDGANLAGADLAGANLDGANLAGANLARAKNIIRVGPTSDGYEFFAVPSGNGLMVKAGCHWFSYAEALAYYAVDRRPIAPERRAYLAAIASIATARGWSLEAKTEAA